MQKKPTPQDSQDSQVWPRDLLDCLDALSQPLERAGFDPLSPWWREQIGRVYAHPSARTAVFRVGRRGRKSATLCRVAVAEVLSGRHLIPPGDTGVVAIVSVDVREATERIATISAIFRALRIEHRQTAKGIEFPDRPYRISVFTASISGVSGFTCICAIGDEVAKWREGDTKVNPAAQILESWRPTMLTQPLAKMFLLSSPMGHDDAHAQAFMRGDSDRQVVAYAPTWIASPSLTEEACRAMSESETEFLREYQAIPQAGGDDGGITEAQIERAQRAEWRRDPSYSYTAGLYPCPRSNIWHLLVATRSKGRGGEVRTRVAMAERWPRSDGARAVLARVKKRLVSYDLQFLWVPSDTGTLLRALAARHELATRLEEVTIDMHESLRMRFDSDGIAIPIDGALRADLLSSRKRVLPSGHIAFEARGYAVLLALVAAKTLIGPDERHLRPGYGTPEWWQEIADQEEARDYAEMRARNDGAYDEADGGWIQQMARKVRGE